MDNRKNAHKPEVNNPNPKSQMDKDSVRNSIQSEDTKVQNPNRNLAEGGNNTPKDKK